MTANIHPTACIAPTAVLADNVSVGAFAVIEDHVTLGAGCQIGAHAVIHAYTQMGEDNVVHPHAVLGGLPQDIHFQASTVSFLRIGDRNVFREGFTAHRATQIDGATRIGSDCYFMSNSHVAHDCSVGNKTIFANNVAIGGFVDVGHNVFMGGAVVVHQFCRIGAFAMVQGTTGINKDVLPFTLIGGRPAKHYRLNLIGLRRSGIEGHRYKLISTAFRLLKANKSLDHLDDSEELRYLKHWLATKSKRGIHGFVELNRPHDED